MEITLRPIGYIRSPFTVRSETPKHGSEDGGATATIELEPEYLEGAADIAPGDSLIVVFHFHKAVETRLTVNIRGDGPLTGVFSTHAPVRPNKLGISTVLVTEVDGTRITFTGVDMLDGTPVIDIKSGPRADDHTSR